MRSKNVSDEKVVTVEEKTVETLSFSPEEQRLIRGLVENFLEKSKHPLLQKFAKALQDAKPSTEQERALAGAEQERASALKTLLDAASAGQPALAAAKAFDKATTLLANLRVQDAKLSVWMSGLGIGKTPSTGRTLIAYPEIDHCFGTFDVPGPGRSLYRYVCADRSLAHVFFLVSEGKWVWKASFPLDKVTSATKARLTVWAGAKRFHGNNDFQDAVNAFVLAGCPDKSKDNESDSMGLGIRDKDNGKAKLFWQVDSADPVTFLREHGK
jgi:hypothetical protein